MKTQFFLVSVLSLAIVPGALLLTGCGGGSSASAPDLRFGRVKDIQFIDYPEYRGILNINFQDKASLPARATGTLQVVDSPNPTPSTESPVSFTVGLPPGTYILNGSILDGTGGFDYDLDLTGSYQGGPRFRLTGNFDDQGLISISAPFNSGDSVLRGRVVPFTGGNATAGGTTAGATTGATTAGATTGAITTGSTTAGSTTGATTGAITAGSTTGSTTTGATTGSTTAGSTTGSATTGATTGSTTAGSTTGGTTVGTPPTVP